MNYKRALISLYQKRLLTEPLSKTKTMYTELHHINYHREPKSCFIEGFSQDTLVRLTYKEHVFAHILLAKIFNNSYFIRAAVFMCCNYRMDKNRPALSWKQFKEIQSQFMCELNRRQWSDPQHIEKMRSFFNSSYFRELHSQVAKDLWSSRREEMSKAISESWKTSKRRSSPEYRAFLSQKCKEQLNSGLRCIIAESNRKRIGYTWINDGKKSRILYKGEPIPSGWSSGMLKRKKESSPDLLRPRTSSSPGCRTSPKT